MFSKFVKYFIFTNCDYAAYSNDIFLYFFLIYVILVFAFEGFAVPNVFVCEVEKPGLFLEKWDI